MTDLFHVEPSAVPPLELARKRLAEAEEAYNEADTDETGQLERELNKCRRIVAALESARMPYSQLKGAKQ